MGFDADTKRIALGTESQKIKLSENGFTVQVFRDGNYVDLVYFDGFDSLNRQKKALFKSNKELRQAAINYVNRQKQTV